MGNALDPTRTNWRLDGTTIIVTIPMQWKRRGGRKVIIAPDGGDAWAPAKPRQDETLIRVLARAHRWKRMLEEGKHRSTRGIAEAEKVDRSFVNRAHSDDRDHPFRSIATSHSGRSRPVWRGWWWRRWTLMVMSVSGGLVKHGGGRPGSQ